MTDSEILKKAVEKAVKNGFKEEIECEASSYYSEDPCVYTNIFSHDFAKAFWGEGTLKIDFHNNTAPAWQYHLRRMVLEPEPLKYLERFLEFQA
jgi:hypothetical protein